MTINGKRGTPSRLISLFKIIERKTIEMGLVRNFNKTLEIWLAHQGIPNITVNEGADYCYFYETHKLQWGMIANPKMESDFGQFFYEYGVNSLQFDPIDIHVISFLHEVGHVLTINNFSEEEMLIYAIEKENLKDIFTYWNLPVELAANVWAINWINAHVSEYKALYALFKSYLSAMSNNEDIMEQIRDWMDDIMDGDTDADLFIVEEDDYEC